MSLMIETPDGPAPYPWPLYLTACEHQARIALHHLNRVWALEQGHGGAAIWRTGFDELAVWADLQGAVMAAIILQRLLKPTGVRDRPAMPRGAAQQQAEERGRRLRTLLSVPEESPLLSVATTRHSLEHVDERIDAIVSARINSVSDWYITRGLWVDGLVSRNAEPGLNLQHVTLRRFDPELGVLVVDEDPIDLFQYEIAVYNLLEHLSDARSTLDKERPAGRSTFGGFRPRQHPDGDLINSRRQHIAQVRRQVRLGEQPAARGEPGT
ncbi:hypothetical protein [Occultella gossypii]|uniref:Uncharacterized protein n=1 Tax=Occultella gossypii TaxID=2800820 RepID=A0ABS7SGU4_9MICO|nr:hypothetical protein [Occultella gossypii]MBZ2198458.1 hypothetical protein [Occultella gossypii]